MIPLNEINEMLMAFEGIFVVGDILVSGGPPRGGWRGVCFCHFPGSLAQLQSNYSLTGVLRLIFFFFFCSWGFSSATTAGDPAL